MKRIFYFLMAITLFSSCEEKDECYTALHIVNPTDTFYLFNIRGDNGYWTTGVQANNTATIEASSFELDPTNSSFEGEFTITFQDPLTYAESKASVIINKCEQTTYTIGTGSSGSCSGSYSGPTDDVQRDSFCQQAYSLVCSGYSSSSSEVQGVCETFNSSSWGYSSSCPYCN